mgnify:CR=1 FL=1|jgi:hypothetical protein
MDNILINEIKKELNKNYSKSDSEQLLAYINNYFMKELTREEKSDIIEGILEIDYRDIDEN